MPLFIDRLPFHRWIDPTRTPALTYWAVVLPVIVTEPALLTPPPVAGIQDWVLDTGNDVGELRRALERRKER